MNKSHALKPIKHAAADITWPSYTGAAHFIGTTLDGRCTVFVDASLGAPVLQNGSDLLADAPRVMAMNDQIFGFPGKHVDVIIWGMNTPPDPPTTDGTAGADHADCTYANGNAIELDASFGNSMRVSALFMAELSECSMSGGA